MKPLKLNLISCGLFALLQLIPAVLCWGDEGHFATCKIAEAYLTKEASAAVRKLLPESAKGELAAVCTWPDLKEIRQGYPWSRELHFADTPDLACTYKYCRDCHDSANQTNRCVTGAIYNYTTQLSSIQRHYLPEGKYNLTEALMFLGHFVGDAHQPLHMGFLGDLGGNRVPVQWFNKSTNLHRVWDDDFILTALDRYYDSNLTNMIEAIKRKINIDWADETHFWKHCDHIVCPNRFASESIHLACNYAYKDATPGTILNEEYFLSRLPVVEKRLAKGGIRLAATLNRIFGYNASVQSVEKQSVLVQ